jgi:hypothetical protein
MTSMPKIEIWAGVLFPTQKWTDANKDSRIQAGEIKPQDRPGYSPSPDDAADDARLFNGMDINSDGALDMDEILSYVRTEGRIDYDLDFDRLIHALKTDGFAEIKSGNTLFVTDKMVPEEAYKVPYAGAFIDKQVALGNVQSVGITVKDGKMSGLSLEGANRKVLIIIPSAKLAGLEGIEKERFYDVLRHEICHARQILDAKPNQAARLRNIMQMSGKIRKDLVEPVYEELNSAFAEGEAYMKSLEYSLQRDDPEFTLLQCLRINHSLSRINLSVQKFEEAGLAEILPYVVTLKEQFMPSAEIARLNEMLKGFAAKHPEKSGQLSLFESITPPKFRELYTAKQ